MESRKKYGIDEPIFRERMETQVQRMNTVWEGERRRDGESSTTERDMVWKGESRMDGKSSINIHTRPCAE